MRAEGRDVYSRRDDLPLCLYLMGRSLTPMPSILSTAALLASLGASQPALRLQMHRGASQNLEARGHRGGWGLLLGVWCSRYTGLRVRVVWEEVRVGEESSRCTCI